MPLKYEWEQEGLYRSYSGKVTSDEILESIIELSTNPKFKNAKYVINDLSEITAHPFNTPDTAVFSEVDKIIAHDKGALFVAFVAPTKELAAITNDYCERMRGTAYTCATFSSIEGARRWITDTLSEQQL